MNRNTAVKQSSSKYDNLSQEDDEDLETYTSADVESTNASAHTKHFKNHNQKLNDDPIADLILMWYKRLQSEAFKPIKLGILAFGPVMVLLFSLFISNTTANLLSFTAFTISAMFIGFSIWLLGQILDHHTGTRGM